MKYAVGDRVRVVSPRDSFAEMYRNLVGTVLYWELSTRGYEVEFDDEELIDTKVFMYEGELCGIDNEEGG